MEMSPAVHCWDKEIFSLLSRGTNVSPHFRSYPSVFFVCFIVFFFTKDCRLFFCNCGLLANELTNGILTLIICIIFP